MRILVALCLSLWILSVTAPRVSALNGHGCTTANAANPSPTVHPRSTPPTESGALVINEVLFNPASQWNCSASADSVPNRWIEIFNPGTVSFILSTSSAETSFITQIDSGPDTPTYYLPDGTTIAAHGFLIVFPGNNPSFFHADVPMLRLLVNGVVIDQVTPLPQFGPDVSFARKPDGGETWQLGQDPAPTLNATNAPSQVNPTPTPTPLPTRTPRITPTPLPTPKVTPISTPHITPLPTLAATPTMQVTPTPLPSNTGTEPAISTTSQVVYSQPSWEELHMPDPTPGGKPSPPPTTSINNPPPAALSPPGETGPMDILRKIAMSIVATALAITLFWCWKLFDTR